ncbi:MAG: two-component regulator propeller domain-containing protein [Rhodothermales bacterium]
MSEFRCLFRRLLISFILILPLDAYSQDVTFEHLDVEDGLAANVVYVMAQDSRGFLWFGTVFGLSRYDGHSFKTYRHNVADSTSISDNRIYEIVEDDEGILWIGTENGLNRFDPELETFKSYQNDPDDPASLSINDINVIMLDDDGSLWVGTLGGGLNHFDPKTERFRRFNINTNSSDGLSDDRVSDIIRDDHGRLWISTMGGGLNLLNEDETIFTQFRHEPGNNQSLKSDFVNALSKGQGDSIWLGTTEGLVRFYPKSNRFEHVMLEAIDGRQAGISDIMVRPEGDLLISTAGQGLIRFEPDSGASTIYRHENTRDIGLASNEVEFVFESGEGLLWVGTFNGVNRMRLEESVFKVFTPSPPTGLPQGHIRSMTWHNDLLWVATGGGPMRYNPATNRFVHFSSSLVRRHSVLRDFVWAVLPETDNTFWVGTDNGLSKLDVEQGLLDYYRYNPIDADPLSLSDNSIRDLWQGSNGNLWIGTLAGGLNKLAPESGKFTSYQHNPDVPDGLSNNEIRVIHESPDGVFWIGTWGGGLNRFDVETGVFTVYQHDPQDPTSIANNVIWSISEATDGTLWLGTDAGLNKVNIPADGNPENVTFTNYAAPNRSETQSGVMPILEDDAGFLWIGYIGGMLARFDPSSVEYRFFMNFAVSRVGSFNAAAKDPESGTLYFGGLNGFLSFNPSEIPPDRLPPQPQLTSLEIYNELILPGVDSPLDQPLSETTSLTLAHDQNDISIGFVGLDYEDPDGVLYDFQLTPYDEDWRGITAQRRAIYTALAPGDYTFRVRTTNRLGTWNDALTTLEIHIRPPLWRTIWAYLVYGIIGLAVLRALDGVRRRRLMQQERERTRERELEQAKQLKHAYDELGEAHASLESEKQKTEEQAAQLKELDHAKSRFFANVSHEFRTPLTLTIGPLEDLQRDAQLAIDAQGRAQIDLALRNAYRVLDLINEILDVAKLESGRLKLQATSQDLNTFVRERAQAFAPLAERKNINFSIESSDDALPVVFDAGQFEKVLANLLSNAFKFTQEGGTIRVTVGENKQGSSDRPVFISVRDNGPGIPADELPHVFDRFHQVNESSMRLQPGTGIGLALVNQLVDRHGGEIRVESEEGFGSIFTVLLRTGDGHFEEADLVDVVPSESAGTLPPSAAWQRAERLLQASDDSLDELSTLAAQEDVTTVLVVEDNAEVRAYVAKHLAQTYHVLQAAHGKEGLEIAKSALPDLVLSDVMMPEMDGYALCEAIKSNRETAFIPVVLLTARADSEDKIEGLQGGADDYITKPFDIQELLARVNNLIASRKILLAHPGKDKPSLQVGKIDITSADEAFLEKVRETIESRIGDESFSVEALADTLGMDRSSLFRRLRATLNQSPAEVLWSFRLERAAQLLEARAGSVSEIAYSVGFKSVAHFSRRFQKHFNVSPSKYADKAV